MRGSKSESAALIRISSQVRGEREADGAIEGENPLWPQIGTTLSLQQMRAVRDGRASAESRRHMNSLGHFLRCHTHLFCRLAMQLNAVRALCGQSNHDRH